MTPPRAVGLFETLLAEQTRVLGADHPHTLTARGNLASAVREAGDPSRAVGMFEALLGDRMRVLGPNHPDTLATRVDLAVARYRLGRRTEAVADLRRLLADLGSLALRDTVLAQRARQLLESWTQQDG